MTHKYIWKKGKKDQPVFVLLHGTGGDEKSLLSVAEFLDPSYNVLSIRGNIDENGMNRYFRRLREGVYDMEDLTFRGKELQSFIEKIVTEKGFSISDVILVGFSNGSNIALNMLLREDNNIKKAILYAPMYPVDLSQNQTDLSRLEVYLSMGKEDPLTSQEANEELIEVFKKRGATPHIYWTKGHELNAEILRDTKEWLN